jgi:hypothetical protein
VKLPEVGKQTFFEVRKSQIRKFLGSSAIANPQISQICQSANRKSANFLLLICKSQIRKFLHSTAQLCLKTVLKDVLLPDFLLRTSFNKSIIGDICKERNDAFEDLRKLKSPNHKTWVRKSQIRKGSHLRKVHKSNKLFKFANLRICDLQNLFTDRSPLEIAE